MAKKNKLGAKAIFARILVVILVTAIGGVASFFGFKTYFASKLSYNGCHSIHNLKFIYIII